MDIKGIIEDAMVYGKAIKIKYQKYGGEYSERTISNIQPSYEFGEGYIKAFCHLRQDERTFKISRIIWAEPITGSSTYFKTELYALQSDPINNHKTSIDSVSSATTSRTTSRFSDQVLWKRQSAIDSYRDTLKNSPTDKKPTNHTPANKKSEGCYIATMAYGDYEHPQVVILRNFRDTVLLSTGLGRAFVRFYYWISPKLVKILQGHQTTNRLIRKILDNLIKIIE